MNRSKRYSSSGTRVANVVSTTSIQTRRILMCRCVYATMRTYTHHSHVLVHKQHTAYVISPTIVHCQFQLHSAERRR